LGAQERRRGHPPRQRADRAQLLTVDEVAGFLAEHHGRPVADVEELSGGFWSSAYGYRAGDDELVVRFGKIRSGFEDDRRAMAYSSADLPVPEVLEIGDAFDGSFAISRRHHGRFLEDVEPGEADAARPMLCRLLLALADAPAAEGERDGSWRAWLRASLADDDPFHPTHGWRAKLRAHPEADGVFRRAEAEVLAHIDAMPERRDLVHGDLLHRNVLVTNDASRVEAVFSWKCSMRGDSVYDAAWCSFWGETFHPGIAALEPLALLAHAGPDVAVRHRTYQLHLGASHLGWYAWTEDLPSLRRLTERVDVLLGHY
jgi:aminoglycoside phosphotransferase (APT) family kinase protein